MSRELEVSIVDISVPSMAALNERMSIKITLFGSGGTLADTAIYVIPPTGDAIDITNNFINTSGSFPSTFITLFQTEYTFQQRGLYLFLAHNSLTMRVFMANSYCSEWASRIDQPISDLNKQRADLQRVFGRLNRG